MHVHTQTFFALMFWIIDSNTKKMISTVSYGEARYVDFTFRKHYTTYNYLLTCIIIAITVYIENACCNRNRSRHETSLCNYNKIQASVTCRHVKFMWKHLSAIAFYHFFWFLIQLQACFSQRIGLPVTKWRLHTRKYVHLESSMSARRIFRSHKERRSFCKFCYILHALVFTAGIR